jgi:orotate phosphoribosyltransferase
MKFPEKYIKHGDFVLHSGKRSDIFYDVTKALTDNSVFDFVVLNIPLREHYIGIATGGALMAIAAHTEYSPLSKLSIIKESKLLGEKPKGEWILFDDVVTTGNSLLEAIALCESNPSEIIVAVDRRRQNEKPKVRAIFEAPYLL